jgi:hypothetical protein
MQGIGFVDEVPDADRDTIIETVRRRLARIPAPTLTFRPATIRPEAIALYPDPTGPLHAIRSEIREAIAEVWTTDRVPEEATGYQAHLSIAYINKDAEPFPTIEAVSRLNPSSVSMTVKSASCITIQRVNHGYNWHNKATVHLGR